MRKVEMAWLMCFGVRFVGSEAATVVGCCRETEHEVWKLEPARDRTPRIGHRCLNCGRTWEAESWFQNVHTDQRTRDYVPAAA